MNAGEVTIKEPAKPKYSVKVPNPLLLGSVVTAIAFWFASNRDFGPDGYFIPMKGVLLVVLGMAPGLAYFRRVRLNPSSVEPLPYLPILGLIFAIYYGLPVLIRDQISFMSLHPSVQSISEALDFAIEGWVCLLIGVYVIGPRLFAASKNRPLRVNWDEQRARKLGLALVAVGSISTVIGELVELPVSLMQIFRLLGLMLRLGLGIFILIDLRGTSSRGWRFMLWFVILPIFMFMHLRTGQIGAFVRPFAFVMMLIWACRFRLPWVSLGVAVLVAILLRGTAAEFRSMLWRSSKVAELGAMERSALYIDTARQNLTTRPGETIEKAVDLISSRTAQLALFAHATHRTPEAVPYWAGESYKTLASSFIPRIVWRDKPTKNVGQRFGHRYSVIHIDDKTTAVNLPQLVELFVNFGPMGVWIGMFGMGLLLSYAGMKLNSSAAGPGTLLVGATIYSEIINIESDFSLVFGALLQTTVIVYFVLRLCGSKVIESELGSSPLRQAPVPRTQ
ncbi:MAG: hypothetical protein ACI87A_001424 [Planctomycetota bacterium]|jgi:hypothetical protein